MKKPYHSMEVEAGDVPTTFNNAVSRRTTVPTMTCTSSGAHLLALANRG
jgi:hypothetical protein